MAASLVSACGPGVGTGQAGSSDTTTTTSTTDTTTSSSSTDTTGTTTTTSTDPDSTSSDGPKPECFSDTFDERCPDDTPICIDGQCRPCTEASPPAACPEPLVCNEVSGACTACTAAEIDACTGQTPVCDPETMACVCTEHAHCSPAACNLFTGQCVEGSVIEVGIGRQHNDLTTAVAALIPRGGGTIIVHDGTYQESVVISSAVIALLAAPGALVEWGAPGNPSQYQLRAASGATVLVDGVEFRGNTSIADPALRASDGQLWVDRARIDHSEYAAVEADTSSAVVLRGSFIEGANDRPAIEVTTGANVDLRYVSVGAGLGTSSAIECDASSTLTITDSIVLTRGVGSEVDCAMVEATHSASNTPLPGLGNVDVGATVTGWFADYAAGDFHLTPVGEAVFADVAQWNDGGLLRDPVVDIDGDPRASVEGAPEPAGADLP